MVIIGSTAIKYWYKDFPREPKDLDIAVYDKLEEATILYNSPRKVEYLENPILLDYLKNNVSNKYKYLPPYMLCTLKASHLMWDVNWSKHMWDYQFLLKKANKIDEELFWKLYDYWNEVHGKNKRSDLKMSKEDFFDNAINYNEHQHDEIHKIVNPNPIYTKVLKDGAEVELDEEKWKKLTWEDKINFIREECYVMAWERYKHLNYRVAFDRMIKKFILSHCPKFALLFTLENYIELTKIKINYIKQIKNGLQTN